jgi:hypothetical protein
VKKEQMISVAGIDASNVPGDFLFYAKDYYAAYKAYQPDERYSPARLFLICRSIEHAAKSLHLRQGRTAGAIKKQIRHDLTKACDSAVLGSFGIALSSTELTELAKADRYYEGKGFEYSIFRFKGEKSDRSGAHEALRGWPNLPDERQLESVLNKLLSVNF